MTDPITLTSECNKKCISLISSNFTINSFSTFLGKDSPIDSYVVLTTVNGIGGKHSYFDPSGAFNNS